jgi:hypothetical protein
MDRPATVKNDPKKGEAMIYHYSPDPSIPPVDTDSDDFQRRIVWACNLLECPYPRIEEYMRFSVDVKDANPVPGTNHVDLGVNLVFALKGKSLTVDAALTAMHPRWTVTAMAGLIGRADLAAGGSEYGEDPPPAKDWEIPGSHIGHPLFYPAGYYQFSLTGEPVGTIIQGASGRSYEHVLSGTGWVLTHAWRAI